GVSGAITALGDTLFPVSTLTQGEALTFSDTAHLFVRLRVWHPTLAVAVGLWLGAVALAAVRVAPALRRHAQVLLALYGLQLALGGANLWLLAPIGLKLAHLLLSAAIWIALVLLAARVRAPSGDALANPVPALSGGDRA